MECYTCDVFSRLNLAFTDVYSNTYGLLSPLLYSLLAGIVAIILVFRIYQSILGKEVMFEDILTKLLVFTLVAGTLSDNGSLWWPVFEFFKNVGPWAGTKIINAFSDYTITREGVPALLEAAENSVFETVFTLLKGQADDIGITSKLSVWIGVLLLSVIYLILAWNLASGILFSYFKIFGIGILSPIFVFFAAFEQTRIYTISGIRLLQTAALELILASAAVAVVLSLMSQISDLFTETVPKVGANNLWGVEYLKILVAGLCMLLAHRVLMSIAEQVSLTFGQNAGNHGRVILERISRFIP